MKDQIIKAIKDSIAVTTKPEEKDAIGLVAKRLASFVTGSFSDREQFLRDCGIRLRFNVKVEYPTHDVNLTFFTGRECANCTKFHLEKGAKVSVTSNPS